MTRQEALERAKAVYYQWHEACFKAELHPVINFIPQMEAAIAAALLEAYAEGMTVADEPHSLYMQEISKAHIEAKALRGEG